MMNRTESAINFICSDDRDVWIMVGMALQAEYGDAARDLWMNWSRQSDSFKEAMHGLYGVHSVALVLGLLRCITKPSKTAGRMKPTKSLQPHR